MTAKLRTLYIGGLPATASPELVRRACEAFGAVEDVRLLPRRDLAIAYVTFADEQTAHRARKALDGATLDGHRLRVDFAS